MPRDAFVFFDGGNACKTLDCCDMVIANPLKTISSILGIVALDFGNLTDAMNSGSVGPVIDRTIAGGIGFINATRPSLSSTAVPAYTDEAYFPSADYKMSDENSFYGQ
jgi:hypothetical protein